MEEENLTTMAQEPGITGAYGSTAVSNSSLHSRTNIPCAYTDEEFRFLLNEAEHSRFQSDEEVRKMFIS